MSDYKKEYVKLEDEIGSKSNKALRTLATYNLQSASVTLLFYIGGYMVGDYLQARYLPQNEHGGGHYGFMFMVGVFFYLIARFYYKNVKFPKVQEKYQKFSEEITSKRKRLNDVKAKLVEEYTGMKLLDTSAFNKAYTIHSEIFKDRNIVFTNSNNEKFLLTEYNLSNVVTLKDANGTLNKLMVTFDDDGVVYYAPYDSNASTIAVQPQ